MFNRKPVDVVIVLERRVGEVVSIVVWLKKSYPIMFFQKFNFVEAALRELETRRVDL